MYRAAIATVAALLAGLLLALVFTLGYVVNDGDTVTPEEIQRDVEDVLGTGEVDFSTLEQIVEILQDEYIGRENLDVQALY